ncbi:VOC family protein [Kribbella italica]|uniref:Catechol 2,3-dioxygenase-like lactoylglutathione lyase family enzyme n=1 Tax=Kribbella italica TaxID=1540520 RepID=A0A7W9JC91_9ACTN|nr:VOC family protein [Kribbella italica]MBB5839471.1 catechol 2,3-dioxygenase-like lactoylglutathione lyase family enzyme [Kribbella italica]
MDFHGGLNVAMKVPKADFERTVAFYRDALGFEVTDESGPHVVDAVPRCASLKFGPVTLWLDQVDNYARGDLWLELFTPDVAAAMEHLKSHGIEARDELEPLPEGSDGHWITNPVGITHLVRSAD